MSITILHITDLHINKDTFSYKTKIDKIANLVSTYGNEEIIILFGGDIINQGKVYYYSQAEKIINDILTKIEDATGISPTPFFVPGNHDIDYPEDFKRDREIIKKMVKNDLIDNHDEEIKKFDKYYEFQTRMYDKWHNKDKDKIQLLNKEKDILYHYRINLEDFSLDVFCINNAMFSYIDKNDKFFDSEMGVLQLRLDIFDKLKKTGNASLALMHFPIEYFNNESKEEILRSFSQNIDLVFTGHIHKESSVKSLSIPNISYIQSGAFNITKDNSEFNLININLESSDAHKNSYLWNDVKHYFERVQEDNIKVLFRKAELSKLVQDREFLRELYKDRVGLSNSFYNYFEFPRLIGSESIYNKDIRIDALKDLYPHLTQHSYFVIHGDEETGKTTLLRYLHQELSKNYLVLYLDSEKVSNPQKPDRLIKRLYSEQYSSGSYEQFNNFPQKFKVLLIDDLDYLNNKVHLLEGFKGMFDKIIFTVSENDIIESLRSLSDGNKVIPESFKIHIQPFFKEKRNNLVKNIFNELNKKYNRDDSDDYIIRVLVDKFDRIMENHLTLFGLNPYMIYMLANKLYINDFSDGKVVYDDVFETNLNEQLRKSALEHNIIRLTPINLLLTRIACFMEVNRTSSITSTEISVIIDEYNKKFQKGFDLTDFINVIIKARIMKKSNGKIYFFNKSYLAYYLSREYIKKLSNFSEYQQDFEKLINGLFNGVNDKILLFIALNQQNENIINLIIDKAEKHFSSLTAIDIKEVGFLKESKEQIQKLSLVTNEDRKKHLESKEKVEEQLITRENESKFEIFEKSFTSFEKNLKASLKYIELIGTILTNFSSTLIEKDEQDKLASYLYIYPNKLLGFLFGKLSDQNDLIINDAFKDLMKNKELANEDEKVIKEMLESQLVDFVRSIFLQIYHVVAQISMDYETDKLITNEKYILNGNMSHVIQNIMFKTFSRRDDNFNGLKKELVNLYNQYDDEKIEGSILFRNCLILIARRILIDYPKYFNFHGEDLKFLNIFFKKEEVENHYLQYRQLIKLKSKKENEKA